MWYTPSPAVVARFSLRRPNRDWKPDWRNTGMPASEGWQRSQLWQSRAWENDHPINWKGDIGAGQSQVTGGTTAEGGPAHSDDTCRRALQLGQRAGDPGLLDHIDEETGREGQSSPTFLIQWCVSLVSFFFFTFTLMITEVSSWNIGKVFFRSYVSLYRRTLFYWLQNWLRIGSKV